MWFSVVGLLAAAAIRTRLAALEAHCVTGAAPVYRTSVRLRSLPFLRVVCEGGIKFLDVDVLRVNHHRCGGRSGGLQACSSSSRTGLACLVVDQEHIVFVLLETCISGIVEWTTVVRSLR